MEKFFKVVSAIFILLFIIFAGVQYNDPDVLLWAYIYLVPAFISFSAFRNRFNAGLIITVAIGALLGAITFFPYGHFEGVALQHGMKTIEIELARESLGLFVVLAAMVIHLVQMKLQQR